MAAPQKHPACNRPGRPFCDKACSRIGFFATNPPCDKPIEDYSTLHRGPRQGFVTQGPRQRYVTEGGGGDRDQAPFRVTAIYMYICKYICIYTHIYLEPYRVSVLSLKPSFTTGTPDLGHR